MLLLSKALGLNFVISAKAFYGHTEKTDKKALLTIIIMMMMTT